MEALLASVAGRLEILNIEYMVVGSLASSIHGEPRGTRDIDFVAKLFRPDVSRLAMAFPEADFYFDTDMARDAVIRGAQFNIIDVHTMWKADIILPRDPFTHAELARRRRIKFRDISVFVSSPEDTVIAKLRWAQMASSSRQIEDAAGILRAQGEGLDEEYMAGWIARLGLEAEWDEVVKLTAD